MQVGEYLPFRWDLETNDEIVVPRDHSRDDTCDASIEGRISERSLKCLFALYNGDTQATSVNDAVNTYVTNCGLPNSYRFDAESNAEVPKTHTLFRDMKTDIDAGAKDLLTDSMGRAYMKLTDEVVKNDDGETILGEYQIALEQVNFKRCTDDGTGTYFWDDDVSVGRTCAQNVSVSDGFVMHNTVLDTETNTDLDTYLNIDGGIVVDKSHYTNVTTNAQVTYDGKTVKDLATEVMDTYAGIAVADAPTDELPFDVRTIDGGIRPLASFTKVASQPIYLYDAAGQDRTLVIAHKPGAAPYTLLVR